MVTRGRPRRALESARRPGLGPQQAPPEALGYGRGEVRAVTYEYGNAFLIVAGLLNLLVVIDAYDVAMGRK